MDKEEKEIDSLDTKEMKHHIENDDGFGKLTCFYCNRNIDENLQNSLVGHWEKRIEIVRSIGS